MTGGGEPKVTVGDVLEGLTNKDLAEFLRAFRPKQSSLDADPESFALALRSEMLDRIAKQSELGVPPAEALYGMSVLIGVLHAAIISAAWLAGDMRGLDLKQSIGLACVFEKVINQSLAAGMRQGGRKSGAMLRARGITPKENLK